MSIPLIMVIAFLIITMGINAFFSRQNTGTKDYFLAKGKLGIPLIAALIFSEVIAGATTVGAAASSFNSGLSCVWTSWGQAMGILLFIIFVGKFYRAMHKAKGVMSVPEAYEYMFDYRSRLVMLFVGVLAYGIIFSTTPMAVASILAPMLNISIPAAAWIVGGIFIAMTLTGGLKGIAWMNTVTSVILYVAMGILAYKSVQAAGGLEAMREAVPSTFFSVLQPNPGTALAGGIGTGIGSVAGAIYANVTFSGKTYRDTKAGLIIAACLLVPFALLPGLIGIAGKVVMPDAESATILYGMSSYFGPVYGGLAAMVACAACFSTGPAFLLQMTTTVTRDFYVALIKPGASDREQVVFSKIAALVLGVVFIFVGLQYRSILDQVLGAFQIRSVVGIVLMVAVMWPRVSPNAAFSSMLAGGAVAAVWHFTGSPFGIAPLWPAAAVTLLILIPVSLMSKEKVSKGYKLYKEMSAQAEEIEAQERSGIDV
ncbi:MAG: sodium:solute symporter family protein [Sporomusa sp.]